MFSKVGKSEEGKLILGEIDPKYYTGDITYAPLIDNKRWQVVLSLISVENYYYCLLDCVAIVDTGVSKIYCPINDIKETNEKIGAVYVKEMDVVCGICILYYGQV